MLDVDSKEVLSVEGSAEVCHDLVELVNNHAFVDDGGKITLVHRVGLKSSPDMGWERWLLVFILVEEDICEWLFEVKEEEADDLSCALEVVVDEDQVGGSAERALPKLVHLMG